MELMERWFRGVRHGSPSIGRRSRVAGQSGAVPNIGFHMMAAPVGLWAADRSEARPQEYPRPLAEAMECTLRHRVKQ